MDDILDSLGNPLEEGKYYQLDFQPRVQYNGPSDTGSVFNFKPPGGRIVVRTLERLQAIPPVRLGDEAGDETDVEYGSPFDNKLNNNNIYDSDTDTEEELDLGNEDYNGGKRRRKKTRRHRKKTRKQRRKTRKHRKKSRKHRKG